ncbi:MAG: DUF4290 domain-containing protein [Candidatus Cryptobacteroides sp.]
MDTPRNEIKLHYNTERQTLRMPEYGRNIFKMVESLRAIPDKAKRSEQARAIVKVMETLNPQVHSQENYSQKLWDHLYMIAGYDLDIDSPYPAPLPEAKQVPPMPIVTYRSPVKANHYGRNIESIIDLIASEPEGEVKTAMIRSLAIYMRQQYLIWNKDSVADETIFADIEKLSDYRIKVPEGLVLSKISNDTNFSRPGMSINVGGSGGNRKNNKRGNRMNRK